MNRLSSGYRIFTWRNLLYWLNPMSYYRWLKYKIQRANRGWAVCDTWDLDHYLCQWLPDALRHIKKVKHGIPSVVFPTDPKFMDETGNPTREAQDIALERWDKILLQIINGFEAMRRVFEMDYEKELGPFPGTDNWLFESRAPRPETKEYYEKIRQLEDRDRALFKEAMGLFTEYYECLWD